ncbi:hypothetical protein LINPERPRIM_LOCUS30825 [Linum perenne]
MSSLVSTSTYSTSPTSATSPITFSPLN